MPRVSEQIPRIAIYAILIFFCFPFEIFSEGKSFIYYIEWKEVKGSRGYVVEVRKSEPPQESIFEKKVLENEIEFRLEAGVYEYRIAALNRFGKPSSYTPWTNFRVEQDRPKAVALAEKEELTLNPASSFIWIPGTGFYQKGDRLQSYGIWLGLGTIALLGNSEREAGNRLASKPLNDPMMIGLLATQLPNSLTYYLWQSRASDKQEYELHQSNQAVLGGIAFLGIFVSLWLENKLPAKDTVNIRVRPEPFGTANSYSGLGFAQSRWEVQYSRSF